MKKLVTLVLALAMLCTLTVPTLATGPADDVDPPLWKSLGYESYEDLLDSGVWDEEDYADIVSYMKEHPEQAAQFRENAYDYFDEEFWYYGSAEQYMAASDMSEETFVTTMMIHQIFSASMDEWYQSQWAQLCREEPERTAQFLEELDGWFAEEYPWYDSLEDYQGTWGSCLEALYLELYDEWNYEYEQQQHREAYLREHGGIPGQINVMIDGQCLSFPAGRPAYAEQGVTYADAATLSRALGVEVPADAAGYAPVRAAAETAGCRVWWDPTFTAAVIIDPAALAGHIDKDFTILNGVLTGMEKISGNYQTNTDCTVDMTIFNSLDGDQDLHVTCSTDMTVSHAGMSGTVRYDASSLMALLNDAGSAGGYEETLGLLKPLLSASMEVRADLESGVVYCYMPSLNGILTLYGLDAPKTAWLSFPLDELERFTEEKQTVTVGSLICAMTLADDSAPGYLYDDVLDAAGRAAILAGDDRFVRRGNAYVLDLEPESLYVLMNDAPSLSYQLMMLKEFSFSLTVRDSGAVEFDLLFRAPMYSSFLSYGKDVRIAASGSISAQAVSLDVEYHLQNQYKVAVTLRQRTSATAAEPKLTPPDNAPVVSLEELAGY